MGRDGELLPEVSCVKGVQFSVSFSVSRGLRAWVE
jgi:hypothetical protein